MLALSKEESLENDSETNLETDSNSQPGNETIRNYVYNPLGNVEHKTFEDNDEPISLEELEEEENKTKRPQHQRPLTKIFIVGILMIPVFAVVYVFLGGFDKPKQIARTIQSSSNTDKEKELLAQNQQLQEQLDAMELELARLNQSANSEPPVNKPETTEPLKPAPPPKPPVRTVATARPAPPPRVRTQVKQTPPPRPISKPTPEELMRRRQLLAQSVVFGGSIGANSVTELKQPEIVQTPRATLVAYQQEEAGAYPTLVPTSDYSQREPSEIDFSVETTASTTVQENKQWQFVPGTMISGKSLHPVFFSDGQSTIVNMTVTDSNTPVPEGTNLSIQLQERGGAVSIVSMKATINNQVFDLKASNWQITASDGLPLVATPASGSQSSNNQFRNTATNVLRNTRQVYRSNDAITSVLMGVGSAIVENELGGNIQNNDFKNAPNIRMIQSDTSIKLYVIQNFEL